MSEQNELEKVLGETNMLELFLELFSRLQNAERLAIKANEALIAFLPSGARDELMDNLINYNQARSSMPIHQLQKRIEAAFYEANVQSH